MGFIQDKDKSIAPRNIVGLQGLFSGSRSSGSGGAIATDEVDYVRLSSGVNEPLAGLGTVDGVVTAAGDLVLCMAQTDPAFRGVYVASLTAWTLKTYISNPKIIIVEEGVTNGETAWLKVESETDSLDYVKVETGGGGGLPAGALGDMLWNDGTDWAVPDYPKLSYYGGMFGMDLTEFCELYANYSGAPAMIMYKTNKTTAPNVYARLNYGGLYMQNLTGQSKGSYMAGSMDGTAGFNKYYGMNPSTPSMYFNPLSNSNQNAQFNLIIGRGGSFQTKRSDRTRNDTAIPFSTTTLFEILNIQPAYNCIASSGYIQHYSYKFKFKLFVTFSSIGGAGGFKLKCSASDGTHAGVFETPSLLKYSAVGAQVWIDDNYNAAVNYNDVQEFTALPTFNDRGMIVEGEVFLNDYAYDNVTFKIEVAQSVNTGTFEIGVGSYIDYEVCNTINN